MSNLELFVTKMSQEGLPSVVIDSFSHYYQQLISNKNTHISEKDILIPQAEEICTQKTLEDFSEKAKKALAHTAVIKINGGLGTSMGLDKAKSLLEAKDGLNFLHITACQIAKLCKKYQLEIPFLLMNSFNTDKESMEALGSFKELYIERFLQHKFPKICQQNLAPIKSENKELEWNPPGHGEIYMALLVSGMLDKLLSKNIFYAFISNIDNLSATLDENILGFFAKNQFPFMMEVTNRSPMDKKGGHLAKNKKGQWLLREIAQCPEKEKTNFQNISRYRYFNTNNLWINLPKLKQHMESSPFNLPMIVNPKELHHKDLGTIPVYQLETAMGTAISLFDDAMVIEVDRSRFAPVKKSNELLLLWSDYFLMKDYRVFRNPKTKYSSVSIGLDPKYYTSIEQLKAKFPYGAPSLLECESLQIEGSITFGKEIKVIGKVSIHAQGPQKIADGTILKGKINL